MEGSKPDDFGNYPLTEELIDGLCVVGARLTAFYNVPIDAEHIMSHAEAAVREGYFGTGDDQRWDRTPSRQRQTASGTRRARYRRRAARTNARSSGLTSGEAQPIYKFLETKNKKY